MNINDIEKRLNDRFADENERFNFSVKEADGIIRLKCFDNENEETFTVQAGNSENIDEILVGLIANLYDIHINPHNKIVKSWKRFSTTKVKSLMKWMQKNNENRITVINVELVNKCKLVEDSKRKVNYYKQFVSALYDIRRENGWIDEKVVNNRKEGIN